MNRCLLLADRRELFSSLLFLSLSRIEFSVDSRVWVFFAENEWARVRKESSC